MNPKDSEQSAFPKTEWSQVAKAADLETESLDRLIRRYWLPLKIYLAAVFPSLRGDAELWLQDFAQDKIIREGWLRKSDRAKGRFRSFLKISLRNFVLDRLRVSAANGEHIELDENSQAEPGRAPEELFDLTWTKVVLVDALSRMEKDCKDPKADQPRRTVIWEVFQVRLVRPLLEDANPPAYDALVETFQLRSPSEASNLLLSGKRIFRLHLRDTIREYAASDIAIASELAELELFVDRLSDQSSGNARSRASARMEGDQL